MSIEVKTMEEKDIASCAEILCAVYNNEMWQCRWSKETAEAYLKDFFDSKKFVGFVLEKEGVILGAMFCREKIWWNNSELYVEEMFILPEYQRQGLGSRLIGEAERYVKEHKLAGFTLSTNKYAPAPKFYEKNGFGVSEHVIFMYKEV